MKTSDAGTPAVRFEARIWRAAYHQQPVTHCDYHEACKSSKTAENTCTCPCYDCKAANAKPQGEAVPASWALYDIESGVRMDYSGSETKANATAIQWNGGKMPEKMREKAESARYLKTILHPGDEVKTILRSCSRSGMSRRISLVVAVDGDVQDITWHAARAMGEAVKQGGNWVQDRGLVVGGCGMDMGFHVVYNLSRTLFPDGFGVACQDCGKRPKSQEDAADAIATGKAGCAAKEPFLHTYYGRNGDKTGWDDDGGYALKQRWL